MTTSITSSGLNTQVGAPTNLPSGQVNHDITGGTRVGTNLFHSFGDFNVATNHIANFLNNTNQNTTNILSRVNGGNPSNIFGTLQTTGFGAANLFLLNPAGIIFGPTASLNVGGSVHISTADYLRLADGARFNAVAGPADALLTSAPVAAFGFLGPQAPAAIAVQGSQLIVPNGETLSFVGGQRGFSDLANGTSAPNGVSITDNSRILAPEGQINVVSVGRPNSSSGGNVNLKGNEDRAAFTPTGFRGLGDITISGGTDLFRASTWLDVSGNSGGNIIIRGGQLQLTNPRILSDTRLGVGGSIVVDGEDVWLTRSGSIDPRFFRIGNATFQNYPDLGEPSSILIQGSRSIHIERIGIGGFVDCAVYPTGPILIKAPKIISKGGVFFVGGGAIPEVARLEFQGTNISLLGTHITGGTNQSPVDLSIQATNLAKIDSTTVTIFSGSGERGSSISIGGKNIELKNSRLTTGNPMGTGDTGTGPITLTAENDVVIDNSELDTYFEFFGFQRTAKGGPGNISVNGKNISIMGSLLSSTLTTNDPSLPGGVISLVARNVSLDDSIFRTWVSSEVPTDAIGTINIRAAQTFKSHNSTLDVSGGFEFGNGGRN